MRDFATIGQWAIIGRAVIGVCGWVLLFAAGLFPAATALAQRPVWQALPDETLAVVRAPAPKEFYEALRSRTKFGAVVFEPRRLEAIKDLLVADAKEDLEAIGAQFQKLGLEPGDLLGLADGELGAALWFAPREDQTSTMSAVVWSLCGDETAEKLLAALERAVDEQLKTDPPARRDDVELAGVKVRHFMLPNFVEARNNATFGIGIKNGMPRGNFDIAERKDGDEKKQNTLNGYNHVLAARAGDALLLFGTMPAGVDGEKPEAAAIEEQRQRGTDEARGQLARLLEARGAAGESPVERWLQTPGLAAALPEGVPLVEAEFNLRAIGPLLDAPDKNELSKLVQGLGLAELGPAAYRMVLDGTTLRSGFFLSAPQPRKGVLALLDQPELPPQPADWVAGDVVGYQHYSIDLGKAYDLIAEIVAGQSQKGKETLQQIELQSQQFLQTDPATLLSSLGTKHSSVSYLPTEPLKKGEDGEEEAAAQNTTAVVWRVTDEALWRRLIGTAALVSGQPLQEEQGFSGLRHETDEASGGWFVGDGKMVLALGKGVTERTLAMLRNPPQTADSLAGGDLARRAAELVPQQPGLAYEITNGPTALRFLNQAAMEMLAGTEDEALKKLREVWPTQEELDGVVGVSASASRADGNGLTHVSVSDLPAP
jgi:hypothetical protein